MKTDAQLEPLATFSLSLIKAMMQAGFYEPGHPEAEKALAHLYDEFRAALADRSELTYMAMAAGADEHTVVIQGYGAQTLALDDIMSAGMAEMFAPKFLEFFHRRNLLSFSIKSDLAPEEFAAFVGLMSQPPSGKLTAREERDRITMEFVGRHILHISTVFHDDVVGRERKLPWWVEVSLSRLSRDLSVLPLYQHASEEDIRRIKVQILDDVIRPIQTPELIKDFLVNCDLVTEIVDLEETALERLIVSRIAVDRLPPTVRELVREIERLSDAAPEQGSDATPEQGDGVTAAVDRCLDVLREIIGRLRREGHAIDYDLLESLLVRGLLTPEELPQDLQDALAVRGLGDRFVARLDEHLAALTRFANGSGDRESVDLLERVFPDLVRRGEYAAAARVVETLTSDPVAAALGDLVKRLRGTLCDDTQITNLLGAFESADKDERHHLVGIFAFIGEPAGPGLLRAYAASSSKAVRSSVFEAVRRVGGEPLAQFLARLPELEKDWAGIRHILSVLADADDAAVAEAIAPLTRHDNLHVRESALEVLCRLSGSAAEAHFLRALQDPEPAVRAVAVGCLEQCGSRHRAAWDFYAGALSNEGGAAEEETVLLKICHLLAQLHDGPAEDAARAAQILESALRPAEPKGMLSRLKKPAPRFSPAVLEAVSEALAAFAPAESTAGR